MTLREKCPNTEFFLARIQSDAGKYGPEKTPYLDTFHVVVCTQYFTRFIPFECKFRPNSKYFYLVIYLNQKIEFFHALCE